MDIRVLLAASAISAAAVAVPDRPVPSDWSVSLGGGALAMPSYPGAASLRVVPLPFIDVRYRDVLFLSPVAGLGVNAFAVENARFGVAFSPDFGRSASSNERLRGFGDISAGAMMKLFGTYRMGPVAWLADVRRELGSGDGTLVDAGLTTMLPLGRRLLLSATATVTWADARYARSYFGIDGAQSAAALLQGSFVPTYAAGAGFRDTAFTLLAIVPLDARWSVQSLVRTELLLGPAAHSPLVERRFQPGFGGFVAYRL
jgi:outer membrane scaffolding protein for murein synthesis (MipA/OmpV family)